MHGCDTVARFWERILDIQPREEIILPRSPRKIKLHKDLVPVPRTLETSLSN